MFIFFFSYRVTEEITERLKSTCSNRLEKEGIVPTQLCCRTAEAQQINDNQLKHLKGSHFFFETCNSIAFVIHR